MIYVCFLTYRVMSMPSRISSLKASISFKRRLPVSMLSSRFEARASIRLAGCHELRSVWLGVAAVGGDYGICHCYHTLIRMCLVKKAICTYHCMCDCLRLTYVPLRPRLFQNKTAYCDVRSWWNAGPCGEIIMKGENISQSVSRP